MRVELELLERRGGADRKRALAGEALGGRKARRHDHSSIAPGSRRAQTPTLGSLQRQHDRPRLQAVPAHTARCAGGCRGGEPQAARSRRLHPAARGRASGRTRRSAGACTGGSSRSSARSSTRSARRSGLRPSSPRPSCGRRPAASRFPRSSTSRTGPGRQFVLPLTHEETFAFHARELQSYKQLPQAWYHFQTKDRDEPRPRGGLLRVREFIMKDSYSFDRDPEGLDASFKAHWGAYDRIFERCGIEFFAVEAESGMMGGSESFDFLAPSGSGENTLVTCEHGDFAADLEVARAIPRAPEFPPSLAAPEADRDAGSHDDRGARRAARRRCGRDLEGDARDPRRRHGRARAGPRRRPARGGEACSGARRCDPRRHGRRDPRGVRRRSGLARPRRLQGRGDRRRHACARASSSPGANRTGWHLRGVEAGRDFEARFADIRVPKEGDRCPNCGGALRFQTAIEVGHIFKLGTTYSEPLGATFLDEDGQERVLQMGSYGIGPGRVLAAAVEQGHDELGIRWPAGIAPYDVARGRADRRRGDRPAGSRGAERDRAPMCSSTTARCDRGRSSRTPT